MWFYSLTANAFKTDYNLCIVFVNTPEAISVLKNLKIKGVCDNLYKNGLPDPIAIPDSSRPYIFNGSNFILITQRTSVLSFSVYCMWLPTNYELNIYLISPFEARTCRVYILYTENYHREYRSRINIIRVVNNLFRNQQYLLINFTTRLIFI